MNDKKTILLDHPLAEHYVGILRDKKTSSEIFRKNLDRLTNLLVYQVTKNLKTKTTKIETPLQITAGEKLNEQVILLPILRAGWGMLDAFEKMIPDVKIGQIGYFRDDKKNYQAQKYYFKLPKITDEATVILLDPMLATGNTIIAACKELAKYQVKICVATLFIAPEGLKAVREMFPDVMIYSVKIDEKLNDKKYIVPGLGDAGDRFFNIQ